MVIKFTTRFIHDHAALRRAVKTHLYNIALALICSLTFCNAQPVCFLYMTAHENLCLLYCVVLYFRTATKYSKAMTEFISAYFHPSVAGQSFPEFARHFLKSTPISRRVSVHWRPHWQRRPWLDWRGMDWLIRRINPKSDSVDGLARSPDAVRYRSYFCLLKSWQKPT